jgi:beta-galactosidase
MFRYWTISVIILLCFVSCYAVDRTPTASIKTRFGVPALFIDDKPFAPFAYMSYLGEERHYQEAAAAGIHLYCFPAYLGDRGINSNSGIGPFRPGIWRGESEFDFSSIRTDFAKILKADPDALVIIRFHLDPPSWWEMANPEACCLLPDDQTFRQCFASPVWQSATGEALRHCLSWLLQSDYSHHLIGIHVAAGGTEEWFYHFQGSFYDRNPARTRAFQAWLRKRYQNDTGLRSAWHDPNVTIETARPADISGSDRSRTWRDPNREQARIDSFRFHAQTMVDNISMFCGLVKEVSQGRLLTGAFYGYHFFVTDPRRGHGALHGLLSCPELDYLSSPNAYHRVVGEDWPPMVALNSVQLHGKLWLAENDTRTSVTTLLKDRAPDICPPGHYASGVWLGPSDIETSVAFLWKNSARMLTHGYGGWWFDMWGGWFSAPELQQVLQLTQHLWEKYPSETIDAMAAEVCVVVDEELCFRDASLGRLSGEILSNGYALAKTGAPYELYLRQDLTALDTKRYRVLWFLGLPELQAREMAELRLRQRSGRLLLWTHPQGTEIHSSRSSKQIMPTKLRWEAQELRALWRQAGVHLYNEKDDVLYAGRGWLCLHTHTGGERHIRLPFPAQVINPITQALMHDSASSFDVQLAEKSTILLRITPKE